MQLADQAPFSAALIDMFQRPTFALIAASLVASAILAGCSTNKPAPITDMHSSTPSTVNNGAGRSYTVGPGDTLYKIAQQHGTTIQAIAHANNITDPSQLRVGQQLVIEGAAASTVAVAKPSKPVAEQPAPTKSEMETETAVETPKALEVPEPPAPVATTSPRASDANLINLVWPASGPIIKGFTADNKGVDIQGAVGDPVVAAASGEVMYAGNGLVGLGNLILLGHANEFITAYAHNDALLVKSGQKIQKGQKIATLGQSDTTSPRLHFEVRRRGTPVNPLSYLPSR